MEVIFMQTMLRNRFIQYAANLFSKCKNVRVGSRSCSTTSFGRKDFALGHHRFTSTIVCATRRYASKADTAFIEFLKSEIAAEKEIGKSRLTKGERPTIPGFHVSADQREVVLIKQHRGESITVTVDVNHSVAPDDSLAKMQTSTGSASSDDGSNMVSKPDFTVEVAKGDHKLIFECSFAEKTMEQEDYGDLLQVDNVCMYTGDAEENKKYYAVSAGILDGVLYDHLMNFLDERGIHNTFAQQLCHLCTCHEHSQYVGLLEKLKDFLPM